MNELDRQGDALKGARRRLDEALLSLVPLVRQLAADGNSLARFVLDEVDAASDALVSENLSASSLIDELERREQDGG